MGRQRFMEQILYLNNNIDPHVAKEDYWYKFYA